MTHTLRTLGDILLSVGEQPEGAWLFLPKSGDWTLDSFAVVLQSQEVPPELEDDEDAGMPAFAKQNNLQCVLPVATVQDIVSSARRQKPAFTSADLFGALKFYYERDAFMVFDE